MAEEIKMKLKFECVLLELLKNDYKLTDDTILEKLVTHLSSGKQESQVIDVPLCTNWVQSALSLWYQGKLNAAIASFALRLLGIIFENENNFINITNQVGSHATYVSGEMSLSNYPVLELFQKVFLLDTKQSSNFSLKFSALKMLLSLLSHSSGRQWILSSGVWEKVLNLSLTDSSIYVVRESRLFMSRLLNEIPGDSDADAERILAQVLELFVNVPISNGSQSDLVKVAPSLFLVSDILEKVFSTIDPESNVVLSAVTNVIQKPRFNLLQKALEILKIADDELLEEQLSKIAAFLYIINIIKDGKGMEPKDLKGVCLEILNVFNILISKGSVHNVLKLCVMCHNHWTHVRKLNEKKNTKEEQEDEIKKYRFEDQLLCLQMIPVCVGCTLDHSTLEEIFLHQVTAIIATENVRVMYLFRDSVVQKGLLDRGGLQAIASLNAVKNLFPRERAVLIFQSFIYVLKHFVVTTDESTIRQGGWGGEFRQSHHSALLVAILDGLAYLVRTYRITWRESVESLCLLSLALQLLDSPTLSAKVGLVVQALRLIQLCIENFMPPNLALLTNSLNGTSFDRIGPLIYNKLHDPHWEVRDSSLEVLHVIATISNHKYPLFQDLILEYKLCEIVVHLALNDAESYVCASATKCLTAMVCVDRLWNEELQDKDLVNKMIGILSGESEGVLRREASLLMSQIFKHRKVTDDVRHQMCVTMSHVAVSDLHWEVKVNGLNFWELVIERSMDNQGMIDGEFPPVTFSKEHRKIVNLTPDVIRDRLRKVLDELSKSGCLHVLLAAICCEEDLEVVKKASQIITSLSNILEQHGLLKIKNSLPTSSKPAIVESLCDMSSLQSPQPSPFNDKSEKCALDVGESLYENDCWESSSKPLNEDTLESFKSIDESSCLKINSGVSILDLDPQIMGFAALEDVKSEASSQLKSHSLQEEVINAILNDRDINLLAKVYLGTEAELPGRQGPETKVSKTIRPLVVLSPDIFLQQLEILQVDQIVTERVRWIEDTGNHLSTLLDDMLIMRRVECDDNADECNAMDCY